MAKVALIDHVFRTPYANPPHAEAGALRHFPEEGAKQEFAEECDINCIMRRYERTGLEPSVDAGAVFGDFSDVGDFLEAHNRVAAAREAFMSLPSKVREQFANDPAKLIEFCSNPENAEAARELGLMKLEEVPQGEVIMRTLRTIAKNTKPAQPAKEK